MTDNTYKSYFISKYDFSLYELTKKTLLHIADRMDNYFVKKIINLPNIEEISSMNNIDFSRYVEMIHETDKFIILNPDYFVANKDDSRILSKDLRIVVNESLAGKIPISIKYKIASLCLLMLIGILDEPIGLNLINDLLSNYGVANIVYLAKGFLYIDLISKKVSRDFQFKGTLQFNKQGFGK